MKDLAEAIAKLIVEFSWRRFAMLMALFALVLVGTLLYERYTSGFQLARIEKSAQILKSLQTIDAQPVPKDPRLREAQLQLYREFVEAMRGSEEPLLAVPVTTPLKF